MARWHSCNVLMPGGQTRELWQFSASSDKFNLLRHESKLPNEKLPENVVGKDWHTLFQPKLNVAWLPPGRVFLRVAQMPKSDLAEMRSMVELQLERLSPLPVAQIVWSFELLEQPDAQMQTVIVVIAPRHHVEEFLGQLEGQGYLPDRLELPLLDQIRATKVQENGAWVYAGAGGDPNSCLVAWWYDGVLCNLTLLHLPADEKRAAFFQEQLKQMSWAGELEGWLTSLPSFHLVADDALAAQWRPLFGNLASVKEVPPVSAQELAGLTARRVASNGLITNLLPPEYTARYRQLFIDRLWMRALFAALAVYVAGVMLYLGWAQFAKWRHTRTNDQLVALGSAYTNAMQLRERLKVLQDQLDLQFAALECWKAVAENLPTELTLDSLNFERGRRLTLSGVAGNEDLQKVFEFNDGLRKIKVKDKPLFAQVTAPTTSPAGGQQIKWIFPCELVRADKE